MHSLILFSLYTNYLLKKYESCVIKNMLLERFWILKKNLFIKKKFIHKEKFGTVAKVKLVTKI